MRSFKTLLLPLESNIGLRRNSDCGTGLNKLCIAHFCGPTTMKAILNFQIRLAVGRFTLSGIPSDMFAWQ